MKNTLHSIQLLRFIAAYLVVMMHSSQAIASILKTPDLLCTLKTGAAKSGQSILESPSYSDALLNALEIESS